jgi:hypothetical protein
MRSKFRLELDIVLDTDALPGVIEAARRQYEIEGAVAIVDEPEGVRALSAEEFIDEIEDALMELSKRNPLLANTNVEVERVACKATETSPEAGLRGGATLKGQKPTEGTTPKTRWTTTNRRMISKSSRRGYICAAGRMESSRW